MKRLLLVGIAALCVGVAIAQNAPGTVKISSLVGSFQLPVINIGPNSAVIPLNGGTFTCATSAATVANTNVDAGSLITITLKTVGGTVAAPFAAVCAAR